MALREGALLQGQGQGALLLECTARAGCDAQGLDALSLGHGALLLGQGAAGLHTVLPHGATAHCAIAWWVGGWGCTVARAECSDAGAGCTAARA